ncbi:MAG: BrnT family toxin [Verrucomicrobia bacterium]|nr:BrnT family toxin [Verrucomicrobiota bacterium]
MVFEYDPNKSQANKEKHGIDFDEAQSLWLDEDRINLPAQSDTEDRNALIALKEEKVWVAFYTMRGTAIRLISVRRARKNEEKTYYDG